jgi:two-component system phosphate regulon sensor histidine kinase PhoR
MAEFDRRTEEAQEEREHAEPASQGSALVFMPTLVGVAAIALFAAEFGLDWRVAAVGAAAVLGAAALALQHGRRRAVAPRAAGGRTAWPDIGIKMLAEALPDPCFVVDQRGRIRYANRTAGTALGAPRIGDPLSFKLRVPAFLEALDRVAGGGPTERIAWSEKVPTERWFEAFIAPLALPAGKAAASRRPDFVAVIVRDLTESHMVDRLRADFVANASHELRTPLAALSGFIETLQGPARNDQAARERFLGVMAEQAGRMKRLIDDLLSLSRIEMRAHVPLRGEVDLAEIIGHVVDAIAPLSLELGVAVETSVEGGPLVVRGDRDELVQVFSNLVENALKYGASGGRVAVTAGRESGPGGRGVAVVGVRDFGPGIAPEHLPRLTERFYRVDVATSRSNKGTGLGLAIVKHILGRHRGRLSIETPADGGALFTVRLDLVAAALEEPPAASQNA